MTTSTLFDAGALRRGVEERDSACLVALYADDAEVYLVDKIATPSKPRVLQGRTAIAAYLDDVCGRDMTHRIDRIVADGAGVSYLESCEYPDGTRVLCASTMDLVDGLIVRQTAVQAWDE